MFSASHNESTPSSFLRSRELAGRGRWEEALSVLREARVADPDSPILREFESEVLLRLGRHQAARELLEPVADSDLTPEGRWRKSWLEAEPRERRGSITEKVVLHPLYGTKRIETVEVSVLGELAEDTKRALSEFHKREFNGRELLFSHACIEVALPSFEQLRNQLQVGAEPEWPAAILGENSCVLVIAQAEEPTAYSAGFGAPGLAVVQLQPDDPFQATVIAHELYHSLLDLNHTNGTEGPLDLGSVMGPFGLRTPLTHTYLAEEHRLFCLTTPQAQTLAESGELEEALRIDPDYIALYPALASLYLQQKLPERALDALRTWFEKDPGPEAASALGRLSMDLGHDPSSYFLRSRGHGEAANTHLYLAQACLDSFRFDAAVTELERAYSLEPENLSLRGMLGWAHHGSGNLESARELYTEALELCGSWEAVRARAAWLEGTAYEAPYPDPDLLWIQSQGEDARAAIATLEGQTDQRCALRRGRAWFSLGDPRQARKDFNACLEQNPYTLPARVANAWLLYLDGSPEAEETLQFALAIWPNNPCALALKQPLR